MICSCDSQVALSLTVDRVDGHRGGAASHAARQEGHVEGGGTLGPSLAQLIQIGKQGEVDYGERHIPGRQREMCVSVCVCIFVEHEAQQM